jgi:hypothetical protein
VDSSLLDPSAKAQQPEHTDFSPPIWDWDTDGVRDTSSRMEQLCIHALLVQPYVPELVSEGKVPPPPASKGFGVRAAGNKAAEASLRRPVWLGRDFQLQRAAGGGAPQRGSWQPLSPLVGPVAAPLAWVEPVVG